MALLVEKTKDKGREKHVPVIEKVDGGIKEITVREYCTRHGLWRS